MAIVQVSKGSIVFCDATKQGSAKILVKADDPTGAPITAALLDTLADVLLLKSDCSLRAETVLDIAREDTPLFTGNKDRKGIVTAQEGDGTVHRWELPGIKVSECEIVQGTNGERIKPASATTLVAAFAACTGLTLVALNCPVIQGL